jgi:hypothetical protein
MRIDRKEDGNIFTAEKWLRTPVMPAAAIRIFGPLPNPALGCADDDIRWPFLQKSKATFLAEWTVL